jgi:hypothetical protein
MTSTAPPPPAPSAKAGAASGKALASADAFIAHLHRCMQTPAGIDTVLLFVAYASRLTASTLDTSVSAALRRRAVALLLSIPAARGKATTAAVVVQPSAGAVRALATSARLRALAALLSEARMVMRLWGLLGLYLSLRKLAAGTFAKKRSSSSSSSAAAAADEKRDPDRARQESLDAGIAWARLGLGIAFQVLENAGLLTQKGVLNLQPATAAWCMRWATRAWSAGTGLEIARLMVEWSRKEQGKVSSQEYRRWKQVWTGDMARNLAWAPLTVHWSLEKGFVNEPMIAILASFAGWIQMSRLWKETA